MLAVQLLSEKLMSKKNALKSSCVEEDDYIFVCVLFLALSEFHLVCMPADLIQKHLLPILGVRCVVV